MKYESFYTSVMTEFCIFLCVYLSHLEGPGVDGRIILRWIFTKWDVGVWTGSSWLRIGKVPGSWECGNEPLGSVKCGEFLD